MIFASTHADPQWQAKQKAEMEFRTSGKQRRYSWDYDDTFEIYSAKQDGTDLVNLTHSPGYDAEGASRRRAANRVLFAARRISARESFSRAARSIRKRSFMVRRHLHHECRRFQRASSDGCAAVTMAARFSLPDGQRIVWRHFEENGAIAECGP